MILLAAYVVADLKMLAFVFWTVSVQHRYANQYILNVVSFAEINFMILSRLEIIPIHKSVTTLL